jgi:hypothetical protein
MKEKFLEQIQTPIKQAALKKALENQKLLAQLGSEVRIIDSIDGEKDLNQVFQRGLLGTRIPFVEVENHYLNPYEQSLLNQNQFKILAVTDFDGVMTQPLKKIGFRNLRWLTRLTEAADLTVIWSCRFLLSDKLKQKMGILRNLLYPIENRICYFPFFDSTSITNLEKLGHDKLIIGKNKHLLGMNDHLDEIVPLDQFDITYYIGSNDRDRKAVQAFIKKKPDFAKRLVFFDTACWLF